MRSTPLEFFVFSRVSYYDNPVYEDYPVINVDFSMAATYCAWAGAEGSDGENGSMLQEGPESLIFPWGNTFESAKLNYCDVNCKGLSDSTFDDGYPDTAPVGTFPRERAGSEHWIWQEMCASGFPARMPIINPEKPSTNPVWTRKN